MARSILTELPRFIPPMLAKSGVPFDSQEHLFELKWDGTRALAFVEKGGHRLVNRHRADVTNRYPELGFLNYLSVGTVLDGEVVVLRQGKPDFRLLLCRNQAQAALKIQSLARTFPATYVVFDLLYDRFESLLALPLWARRQRLEAVVRACANPRLVFSEGIVGSGRDFFEAVCREGLEGVVAKRFDGRYRPGRCDWIKIKPRSGSPDGMTC
jgi:bifunctional non-homologous end joining protein LigD